MLQEVVAGRAAHQAAEEELEPRAAETLLRVVEEEEAPLIPSARGDAPAEEAPPVPVSRAAAEGAAPEPLDEIPAGEQAPARMSWAAAEEAVSEPIHEFPADEAASAPASGAAAEEAISKPPNEIPPKGAASAPLSWAAAEEAVSQPLDEAAAPPESGTSSEEFWLEPPNEMPEEEVVAAPYEEDFGGETEKQTGADLDGGGGALPAEGAPRNGSHAHQIGPAGEASLADAIDMDPSNPELAEIGAPSPTLLERLRGVAEEPAEAEKQPPLSDDWLRR